MVPRGANRMMANPSYNCVVCGKGPTVKAHFIPRALALDMKGSSRTLSSISRHRPGYREHQNGRWDDRFLCKVHEDAAGQGDEYAITLHRRFMRDARRHHRGNVVTIDNPHPDLLMKFIYGVVWRHIAAPSSNISVHALGAYRSIIERALFEDGSLELEAIASIPNLRMHGTKPVQIGIEPYAVRIDAVRGWHFVLGHLQFVLKTDKRPFPAHLRRWLASHSTLALLEDAPTDLAAYSPIAFAQQQLRGLPRKPLS